MIPRFHCPGLTCVVGEVLALPPAVAHHAVRVLRLQAGDAVVLFDGRGQAWQAELQSAGPAGRKPDSARITAQDSAQRESPLQIVLAQCLPAADKMDWIVQKAVELGVAAIQPLQARRSVVRLSGERAHKRLAHWNEVAAAACEQCGRNRVPTVLPLLDLTDFLASANGNDALRCLLDPERGRSLRELTPSASRPLSLLIGPEGGFDPLELHAAQRAGFQSLRLGPRVLRTETAGLAALAACMALWGDF